MDFGVVGLANLLSSDSHSNNGSAFASETGVADVTKHRLYGSGSLKQESTVDEDDYLRAFKLAKTTSSCPKIPCNNTTGLSEHHRQMLSFSSPNSQMLSFSSHNSQPVEIPFYPHSASATDRSPGYGCGGVNATAVQGVRGPFTASQWMELEHQALIYKYITANVPIPFYLLNPIRKALESSSISCFSLLRPSALGWGADFHLRFSNTDPEPGRCRRTDGKKWRCSRDAVPDQKYCERHMNRGRHRSRKPVEGQPGHSASGPTGKPLPAAASVVPAGGASKSLTLLHHPSSYIESSRSEFGSVSSDSLLNPLSKNSPFINCGHSESLNDGTQLSIAITSDFMSSNVSQPDEKLTASPLRLSIASDQTRRQNNWVPISWEPSIGGPLGEALHTTTNNTDECKNSKALNLIENWDHSTRFGLYRGPYGSVSNSSAGSSPSAESSKVALDGPTFYNGLIGPGLVLPSLPAL